MSVRNMAQGAVVRTCVDFHFGNENLVPKLKHCSITSFTVLDNLSHSNLQAKSLASGRFAAYPRHCFDCSVCEALGSVHFRTKAVMQGVLVLRLAVGASRLFEAMGFCAMPCYAMLRHWVTVKV